MFVIKKISGQCGNRTQISSLQKNPPAFGITPLCWIDKIRTCKPFAYQAIAPPLSYYPICWCDRIWTYFLHIMSVLLYRLSFASESRSITDSNREHLIDNQRLYHFTNRPMYYRRDSNSLEIPHWKCGGSTTLPSVAFSSEGSIMLFILIILKNGF